MAGKNKDILKIKQYLAGKLDERAMYDLERRAQDDPFLMDALEGYENTGSPQDENLEELTQRLKQRLNVKERRLMPWRMIAAAAMVLLALTAGLLWYMQKQPIPKTQIAAIHQSVAKKPADTLAFAPQKAVAVVQLKKKVGIKKHLSPYLIADNKKPQANAAQAPNADINIDGPVGNSNMIASADKPQAVYKSAPMTGEKLGPVGKKDTTTLNEVTVVGFGVKRRTSITGSVSSINPTDLSGKTIKGVVKDESGPLPGAMVKVTGTNNASQTDANGRFVLYNVPDKALLSVNFVGYKPMQVQVRKQDTLMITMQPNSNALAEVVVVKSVNDQTPPEYQPAHPYNGWVAFKKYLEANASSPDGKTGVVKLSFTVNMDNSLTGFAIIKGISAQTDSAAVNLVRNGPNWVRSTGGKAEKVKVRIKFKAVK
jgi:cytoskeletal protein RodZ